MKIYWYWPFAREEEMGLVPAVVRADDELLVDVLDRPASPPPDSGESWTVRAGVREVSPRTAGSARWLASRGRTYVGRARDREQAVRRWQPDLAHLKFLNPFVDPAALGRLSRRCSLVSTVHDVVPHRSRLPSRFERLLLQRLYDRAGHLLVHHETVRQRLLAEFDVASDRVTVIEPQVPRLAALPEESGPAGTPGRTVLFLGTLRPNKGLDVLLEAFTALPDPSARLVVAGRGDPAVESRLASAARLDARISAEIGWVTPERKAHLLRTADLVALPYLSFASQSGVLHDAYAAGRPLLVTDVGALADTVRRDGTGWVVPAGDVDQLATALQLALADDDGRRHRAAAARAVADDRGAEVVASRLRMLYDDVLDGRKPC